MKAIFYEFDKLPVPKTNNYIFQYIYNRQLSNICHYHDFYEIIYIIDGECEQEVNNININMKQGDFLILRPYESHIFTNQSNDIKIVCLSVKKDEFERIVQIYSNTPQDTVLLKQQQIIFHSERILTGLNDITAYYNENDLKLLLCSVINMYFNSSTKNGKTPKALNYAMLEMKKAENLKIGISAFVKLSNYSQSHLTRLMKKYYNISIHDYILRIRLEKAYNDIVLTKQSLEQISEAVGYESFSHFNKIFKNKYNITPSALRKQHSLWTV